MRVPDRTVKADDSGKANKMRWKEEEISFLKQNPKMSIKEQAERLGRSYNSVRARRDRLSLYSRKLQIPERFSQEEKILRIHALMAKHNLKLKEGAE